MVTTMYNRVRLSEPLLRLVLLLLMATCLTGCGLQFPFYCEDDNASICYLQRRPIFAPREKPPSNTTSNRQTWSSSSARCLFPPAQLETVLIVELYSHIYSQ